MLANNVIGMDTKSVSVNVKKMNDEISVENKIEGTLVNLNERAKGAYSSGNSHKLNSNGSSIADAVHVKAKNLKSFKLYTEKYISVYTNVSTKAEDTSAALANSLKQKV